MFTEISCHIPVLLCRAVDTPFQDTIHASIHAHTHNINGSFIRSTRLVKFPTDKLLSP